MTDRDTLRLAAPTKMERARHMIAQIDDLAEGPDLPEAGIDYAADVQRKANEIGETLDRYEAGGREPTEGQLTALANMLDGLERWCGQG